MLCTVGDPGQLGLPDENVPSGGSRISCRGGHQPHKGAPTPYAATFHRIVAFRRGHSGCAPGSANDPHCENNLNKLLYVFVTFN